ncbi:kinase-like domain-containing protein [Aspergillus undulatus]|uniref:kinase-like domain-containing protein n=1 Tax=Aspergillus undulatus TaxID=1810928 RepID=UPI003CCE1550
MIASATATGLSINSHKLGHGSYSTTWLAQDEISEKYVAVKVCTADSNPLEIDVISDCPNTNNYKFNIKGPNDEHLCFVTSPARVSLSAAQLVLAVHYLHSQQYVHGDLYYGNILLQLPHGFDQLSAEELYELHDEHDLPPGVPQHGVLPVWSGEASEDIPLAEAQILLSDFGEAFSPVQENRFQSHTLLLIRPPQARFDSTTPLTFLSDIWPLACIIWYIMAQRTLFEGLFTNEGNMTSQHAFLSMLRPMLAYKPENRPSAQQIFESEWIVRWPFPSTKRSARPSNLEI